MASEMNDLKGIIILILCAIYTVASTNINCHGRAFHCVNSTHFMICVDLGGGISTTIDDFVIPCPPTTMCHENNAFECEFIYTVMNNPIAEVTIAPIQSDLSVTDAVTNNVNVTTEMPSTVISENVYVTKSQAPPDKKTVLPESEIQEKTVIENAPIQSDLSVTDAVTNNVNVTTEMPSTVMAENVTVTKSQAPPDNKPVLPESEIQEKNRAVIENTPIQSNLSVMDAVNNNVNVTTKLPRAVIAENVTVTKSQAPPHNKPVVPESEIQEKYEAVIENAPIQSDLSVTDAVNNNVNVTTKLPNAIIATVIKSHAPLDNQPVSPESEIQEKYEAVIENAPIQSDLSVTDAVNNNSNVTTKLPNAIIATVIKSHAPLDNQPVSPESEIQEKNEEVIENAPMNSDLRVTYAVNNNVNVSTKLPRAVIAENYTVIKSHAPQDKQPVSPESEIQETNEEVIENAPMNSDLRVTDAVNNNVNVSTKLASAVIADNVTAIKFHASPYKQPVSPKPELQKTFEETIENVMEGPIILPPSTFNHSKVHVVASDKADNATKEYNSPVNEKPFEENVISKDVHSKDSPLMLPANKLNNSGTEITSDYVHNLTNNTEVFEVTTGTNIVQNMDVSIIPPVSKLNKNEISPIKNTNPPEETIGAKSEQNMEAATNLQVSKFNDIGIQFVSDVNFNSSAYDISSAIHTDHFNESIIPPVMQFSVSEQAVDSNATKDSNSFFDSKPIQENTDAVTEQNMNATSLPINGLNNNEARFVAITNITTKEHNSASDRKSVEEVFVSANIQNKDASINLSISNLKDSGVKVLAKKGNDSGISSVNVINGIVTVDIAAVTDNLTTELFSTDMPISTTERPSVNINNNSFSAHATTIHQYVMEHTTKVPEPVVAVISNVSGTRVTDIEIRMTPTQSWVKSEGVPHVIAVIGENQIAAELPLITVPPENIVNEVKETQTIASTINVKKEEQIQNVEITDKNQTAAELPLITVPPENIVNEVKETPTIASTINVKKEEQIQNVEITEKNQTAAELPLITVPPKNIVNEVKETPTIASTINVKKEEQLENVEITDKNQTAAELSLITVPPENIVHEVKETPTIASTINVKKEEQIQNVEITEKNQTAAELPLITVPPENIVHEIKETQTIASTINVKKKEQLQNVEIAYKNQTAAELPLITVPPKNIVNEVKETPTIASTINVKKEEQLENVEITDKNQTAAELPLITVPSENIVNELKETPTIASTINVKKEEQLQNVEITDKNQTAAELPLITVPPENIVNEVKETPTIASTINVKKEEQLQNVEINTNNIKTKPAELPLITVPSENIVNEVKETPTIASTINVKKEEQIQNVEITEKNQTAAELPLITVPPVNIVNEVNETLTITSTKNINKEGQSENFEITNKNQTPAELPLITVPPENIVNEVKETQTIASTINVKKEAQLQNVEINTNNIKTKPAELPLITVPPENIVHKVKETLTITSTINIKKEEQLENVEITDKNQTAAELPLITVPPENIVNEVKETPTIASTINVKKEEQIQNVEITEKNQTAAELPLITVPPENIVHEIKETQTIASTINVKKKEQLQNVEIAYKNQTAAELPLITVPPENIVNEVKETPTIASTINVKKEEQIQNVEITEKNQTAAELPLITVPPVNIVNEVNETLTITSTKNINKEGQLENFEITDKYQTAAELPSENIDNEVKETPTVSSTINHIKEEQLVESTTPKIIAKLNALSGTDVTDNGPNSEVFIETEIVTSRTQKMSEQLDITASSTVDNVSNQLNITQQVKQGIPTSINALEKYKMDVITKEILSTENIATPNNETISFDVNNLELKFMNITNTSIDLSTAQEKPPQNISFTYNSSNSDSKHEQSTSAVIDNLSLNVGIFKTTTIIPELYDTSTVSVPKVQEVSLDKIGDFMNLNNTSSEIKNVELSGTTISPQAASDLSVNNLSTSEPNIVSTIVNLESGKVNEMNTVPATTRATLIMENSILSVVATVETTTLSPSTELYTSTTKVNIVANDLNTDKIGLDKTGNVINSTLTTTAADSNDMNVEVINNKSNNFSLDYPAFSNSFKTETTISHETLPRLKEQPEHTLSLEVFTETRTPQQKVNNAVEKVKNNIAYNSTSPKLEQVTKLPVNETLQLDNTVPLSSMKKINAFELTTESTSTDSIDETTIRTVTTTISDNRSDKANNNDNLSNGSKTTSLDMTLISNTSPSAVTFLEKGNMNPLHAKSDYVATERVSDFGITLRTKPDIPKVTTEKSSVLSSITTPSTTLAQTSPTYTTSKITTETPRQSDQKLTTLVGVRQDIKSLPVVPTTSTITTSLYGNQSPPLLNTVYVTTENSNIAIPTQSSGNIKPVKVKNIMLEKSKGNIQNNNNIFNSSASNVTITSTASVSTIQVTQEKIKKNDTESLTALSEATEKQTVYPSEVSQSATEKLSVSYLYQATPVPVAKTTVDVPTTQQSLSKEFIDNNINPDSMIETTTSLPVTDRLTVPSFVAQTTILHIMNKTVPRASQEHAINSNKNHIEKNIVLTEENANTATGKALYIDNTTNVNVKAENISTPITANAKDSNFGNFTTEVVNTSSTRVGNGTHIYPQTSNLSEDKLFTNGSITSTRFNVSKTINSSNENKIIQHVESVTEITDKKINKIQNNSGNVIHSHELPQLQLNTLNNATVTIHMEIHLNETDSNLVKLNNNKNVTGVVPKPFVCLNHTRGKYADNRDCRKFYNCVGTLEPIVGTCPNNTVFSDVNKQCTRNLSHCVRNNQFRCLIDGRFTDLVKDNVYYICLKNRIKNGFVRYKFQCKKNYHLNRVTVKCEKELAILNQQMSELKTLKVDDGADKISKNKTESKSKASKNSTVTSKTNTTSKDTSSDFKCEDEGKFPHAKECRKYYQCTKISNDDYSLTIKECSDNEDFDKKKKTCVESDSSEC